MPLNVQQNQTPLNANKNANGKTIYQTNFDLIEQLGFLEHGKPVDFAKSESDGHMDLIIKALPLMDDYCGQSGYALSMAHYFEKYRDLCMQNEMVVLINPNNKTVEAVTFEQAIPPLSLHHENYSYQSVYSQDKTMDSQAKQSLNEILGQWLKNLSAQGHCKEWMKIKRDNLVIQDVITPF